MKTAVVDYEITSKVNKPRRLVLFLVETVSIALITLFAFALGGVEIIKSIPSYQTQEAERIEYRDKLNQVGKESKLARFYNDGSSIDEYGMYIRYCYKHIHLMFELYPDDFTSSHFNTINDPYNEVTASKESDELFYFFTDYSVKKGLITTENPVDNYQNNILDLTKHNNIMVFNEDMGMMTLNPKLTANGGEVNFGVSLYTELFDDNKSFAMNSMYKFYCEYYELANDWLTQTDDYQNAYQKYESASLITGQYITYTFLITYLLIALAYYLISPLTTKEGKTPFRMLFRIGLFDTNGQYVCFYKKLIYGLLQVVFGFFVLFFSFYFGYGFSFFSYAFGVIGNFLVTPLLFIVISASLVFVNSVASFFPTFSEEKATPVEYLLKIRYVDLREER